MYCQSRSAFQVLLLTFEHLKQRPTMDTNATRFQNTLAALPDRTNPMRSFSSTSMSEITEEEFSQDDNLGSGEMYQRMTPREHVLKRPEPYIGSTKADSVVTLVYDVKTNKMSTREISLVCIQCTYASFPFVHICLYAFI